LNRELEETGKGRKRRKEDWKGKEMEGKGMEKELAPLI
jgi:hypothetical protein